MSFEFATHFIIMKWSTAQRVVLVRNPKCPLSVEQLWKVFRQSLIRDNPIAVVWATRLGVFWTMLRKFVCQSTNALMLGSCWLLLSAAVCAEEPVEAYLDALQDRGYTEVALRYLDRIAESDLVPSSFRDEVPYRKGEFLVDAARATKSRTRRQAYLDQAQQVFDSFVKNNPAHPDIVLARGQLGNILVERARSLTNRAEQASDAEPRNALRKQAFDVYQDAYEALRKSKTELGEQYKSLVSNRDPDSREKLKQVKSQYVTTYLMLGRVLFEQAKTIQADEELYKQKLTEAAKAFDEVATKYRTFSAGLYATLYQGECYQRLGEDKRALSYFKELLQSNAGKNRIVRRLKTTALARSIDSWLKTDAATGPDRSIQWADEWIKTKRGAEDRTAPWLDFRLSQAKAYLAKSKIVQGDKEAERAMKSAREIAQDLARRKSDVQAEAQQMLVAMGKGGEDPVVAQDPSEVESFIEARDAAKAALGAMKLEKTKVSILTSQLKKIRNPERRSQIQTNIAAAQAVVDQQAANALLLFQRADSLASAEDVDDLQSVRYYLSYLYYTLKDFRRAAVIASHTALRYPDSVAAKECANVAIAARQRLYQVLPRENRGTQMKGIARLGELLVSKWPDDPAASSALTTLLDVSIAQGNIAQARTYLDRIAEDSPKRAVAELRFGQKLWSEYLQQSLAPSETAASDREDLKQQAKALLRQGVARSQGMAPNESAIRGSLSLAKILVDSGQPQEALTLLGQEGIGAVKLVQSDSRWVERIPGLSVDAYTTAIRAHIASAASAVDSEASIRVAEEMLTDLRETLETQPDGKARMIRIYVNLAQDLERQLAVASPEAQIALSQGFESFLKKAAAGSDDLSVLNWVAQTFYSMGNGLIQGRKSSPEAQRYFTEATNVYGLVLQKLDSDPQALPESTVLQVRVRQAMALRQTGDYEASIELFAEVLSQKRFLNIQVEAAETLQQWGMFGGNAEALMQAIQGCRRGGNGQNLIWGWGRIAKLVAREANHRDTFHDARYNIAKCRYEWGKKQSGAAQKQAFVRARADLIATQKLYGLGNKSQRQRYEKLLKVIQKSLGQASTGFPKS